MKYSALLLAICLLFSCKKDKISCLANQDCTEKIRIELGFEPYEEGILATYYLQLYQYGDCQIFAISCSLCNMVDRFVDCNNEEICLGEDCRPIREDAVFVRTIGFDDF